MMMPKIRVRPEVGVEQADRGQRPGVRRHEPVQHGQAGQRGDADLHQRQPGALGDEDDHRHEQHDADLEEQRQAEDGRDRRHHPRQAARPDPADQRRDDAVGAAGVLEQLADHRAERDEDADRAGRGAEPGHEALDGVARRHRRHGAEHRRAEHQGQERVHLGPGDEHDDGEDAQDARRDELRAPGVHRGFVGEREAGGDGRGERGGKGEQGHQACSFRWPSAASARSRTWAALPSLVMVDARLVVPERFEGGQLAGQQGRRHVVARAVLHPVEDDVGLGGDVQEPHVRAALAQQVAVDPAQGRAGDHRGLAAALLGRDPVADGLEPRPAVLVGERGAAAHLGDVGLGVEGVALGELPAEHGGQPLRDRRLPAPGDTHDDDDVRIGPPGTNIAVGHAGNVDPQVVPWPVVRSRFARGGSGRSAQLAPGLGQQLRDAVAARRPRRRPRPAR